MTVTAAQVQQFIIEEVGDVATPSFPDGLLNARIAGYWDSYADRAYWPRLQELYTHRRCIDVILPILNPQVDYSMSGDLRVNLYQRTQGLLLRRKELNEQISCEELKAQALRPGVVEPLVASQIEPDPLTQPFPDPLPWNANSPVWRGDPYWTRLPQGTPIW